jgi:hypothetical protein
MSNQSLARMSRAELLHRKKRLRTLLVLTVFALLGFAAFLLRQVWQHGEITILIPGGGFLIAVGISLYSSLRHIEAELKRRDQA